MIGSHVVMDRPDSVSRVTAPNSAMTKIIAQHPTSQTVTDLWGDEVVILIPISDQEWWCRYCRYPP